MTHRKDGRKAAKAAWDGAIGAAPPSASEDPLKATVAASAVGFAKAPRKGQDEELTEMEVRVGALTRPHGRCR